VKTVSRRLGSSTSTSLRLFSARPVHADEVVRVGDVGGGRAHWDSSGVEAARSAAARPRRRAAALARGRRGHGRAAAAPGHAAAALRRRRWSPARWCHARRCSGRCWLRPAGRPDAPRPAGAARAGRRGVRSPGAAAAGWPGAGARGRSRSRWVRCSQPAACRTRVRSGAAGRVSAGAQTGDVALGHHGTRGAAGRDRTGNGSAAGLADTPAVERGPGDEARCAEGVPARVRA
jgi:hypothetical protein